MNTRDGGDTRLRGRDSSLTFDDGSTRSADYVSFADDSRVLMHGHERPARATRVLS